jgi:hypothetical protein
VAQQITLDGLSVAAKGSAGCCSHQNERKNAQKSVAFPHRDLPPKWQQKL